MSLQSELPGKGSSDFRMSTKVYYQSLNNATLTPADGNVRNTDKPSHPIQVLHSATDRSLVPLGEFDAFPVAEKSSPTQLFSFTSRKGTDLFKVIPTDEVQLKSGKGRGGRKVSFTSGDLIDSEDVLRLECLQGGAFKMFIPSSPELSRPPLCFEIKPPANVILDLPKCQRKPNIKVVVTTICSTGNSNEKSHQQSEGGIDVQTSNLEDLEIEELIRELCQVIVETHKQEARSSQRKQLMEPPQVVELYKRKKIPEEENSNCEYAVLSNTDAYNDTAFTYHHEDEGFFYFQPQSEPKGSSVRLFVDKICGCLGKAFGLISSDNVDRRPAPMKLEVDNDPEEGHVRCLLMGKTPKAEGDDCACDQQPVAEIRNSSELMDKQSPLVDRIMYLLRRGASREYSNEKFMEENGDGDYSTRGNKDADGSAGGTAKEMEGMDVDIEDNASHRKAKGDKNHTRFRTGSGKEMVDSVEDDTEGAKEKNKRKGKSGKKLCCARGVDHKDKPYQPVDSKEPPDAEKGGSDEVVHKDAAKEKVSKHKKKAESMEVIDRDKVKPSESAGDIKRPSALVSNSKEVLHKTKKDRKKNNQEENPEETSIHEETSKEAIIAKPSESKRLLKRYSLRRGGGNKEANVQPTMDGKKDKRKKSNKGSDDESDSSKSRMKKSKSKEREESKKRPIVSERKKMIGSRDKEYWASYRRLRRRQMENQESEFKESVISARLSVDASQIPSESSSDSDAYVVELSRENPIHKDIKRNTSGRYRSSGRSQLHRTYSQEECSESSRKPLRTKNNAAESRPLTDDSAMPEKRKSSSKSTHRRKPSEEKHLDSSCDELSTKSVHGEKPRDADKCLSEGSKSLQRLKSNSKFQRVIDGAKSLHKKHQKGIFRREQKEDTGINTYISGSSKMQDDETDPRNISEVMEAQVLKDEFDKKKLQSKDKCANAAETDKDSNINLVIPCGTCPSEEADFIGLSSWENPITKSRTAIDSRCESLCISCNKSITSSQIKEQTFETTPSSTTSITSRKSILVDRGLPGAINCCSASVFTSGLPAAPILPVTASLDSKLRQQEHLEKLNPMDSLTDSASLQTGTDSSDQTLDTSASEITNNSSSVEVETRSTTFDSGTSVVSNVTIDNAFAQNPFNESTESRDTTCRSNSSCKIRELSSTAVDTWSSISSASDILRNQSSIASYQDTSSAIDLASGLSSDGSRSLINSTNEPLSSDLKCDDGSQSADLRSTIALSATSTIDSGLSMGSLITSESIETQDCEISNDIGNSDDVSFESRDSYRNDLRSPSSCSTSEIEGKTSNTLTLKSGASKHMIFSEISKPRSSRCAVSLELSATNVANSTTSLSGRQERKIESTSQHAIAPPSENPAAIKIHSADAILTDASKADALIASPSRVSSEASINSTKQICYQVPVMGPTFTDAIISAAATDTESNHSALHSSNNVQETYDNPVVETDAVLGDESASEHGEVGILNNGNESNCTCLELPVELEEDLIRAANVKISEENLHIDKENPPAETLEQLPKEKEPNETTVDESLVENANDSNETENPRSKKKISRRRHNVMATFMCITRPCRSARHSDSYSAYMPSQPFPGLDASRNLSDTIPQTDKRLRDQPHSKRRLFANHFRGKKTASIENTDNKNTNKSNEEIKLKSILSKTLHKDNRCKLTKKVSFSPNNSFIEAPGTSDSSASRSQSESEAEVQAMSHLRAFGIQSSSSDSILPSTASPQYLANVKTSPTARTSLIRARGSFSGEIDRDLRQREARRLGRTSSDDRDDSESCLFRDDDDDTSFEINSGKTREPYRLRLQLSNVMCESIPPKSSTDSLKCMDNFQDDVDECGLMIKEDSDSGSERSTQDSNEQDRKKTEKTGRENYFEERSSQNMSSKIDEKCKLVSTPKTKNRKIDFLKDCSIENEDAELEQENSKRKLFKKRQHFVQKVSSLLKVTPLEENNEKMDIADSDPIESGKTKEKKNERKNEKNKKSRDDDSSPGQKHSRGPRSEDDRHRKASK